MASDQGSIFFATHRRPWSITSPATPMEIMPTRMMSVRSTLRASEFDVLVKIVFRAALPQIVTGIRVGLGVGWMALVAAELVGATSGLGWLISDARSVLRTDIILVGMISIGVAGLVIDQGLRWVAKKMLPWSLAMTR